MQSMTGYGEGETPLGQGRVSLEIRALNHRFVEVRVRLPAELSEHAAFLEQLCRKRVVRGRFDLTVRTAGSTLPRAALDAARLTQTYKELAALRDTLAPGTALPVTALLSLPEHIRSSGELDSTAARGALESALNAALAQLTKMKVTEGAALATELSARLSSARALVESIAQRAPQLAALQFERLRLRAKALLGGVAMVDSDRLHTELALLADKSDVTEELVRLRSHLNQFAARLEQTGPVGRELEFLLQEIGRETNTIGAKCQDAALSGSVVSLKGEVERLREQVQNVE